MAPREGCFGVVESVPRAMPRPVKMVRVHHWCSGPRFSQLHASTSKCNNPSSLRPEHQDRREGEEIPDPRLGILARVLDWSRQAGTGRNAGQKRARLRRESDEFVHDARFHLHLLLSVY